MGITTRQNHKGGKMSGKSKNHQTHKNEDVSQEIKKEWKHLNKFKDENRLLFAAFIIVLTSIVVLNAFYVINSSNSQKRPVITQDETTQILTSRQTGSNTAQTVSVSNVAENDKKDYAFTIDPSETMLILDVSITNNTNDTQHLIPANQLYVRSSEGDYATLHASMYVKTPLQSQDLAPGKTAKGQVSFNVPKREAKPLLYVDTGWDNHVPIVFDVLH